MEPHLRIYDFTACVMDKNKVDSHIPFTANNSFYIPGKSVSFNCGGKQINLSQFQSLGYDVGSNVYDKLDISIDE